MAIVGKTGHVASFDWQTGTMHAELQLRESCRAILSRTSMPPRPIGPVISATGSSSTSSTRSTFARDPGEFEAPQNGSFPESYSRSRPPSRSTSQRNIPDGFKEVLTYEGAVTHLTLAKATPFTVSGYIPLPSGSNIALFFRSPVCIDFTSYVSFKVDMPYM